MTTKMLLPQLLVASLVAVSEAAPHRDSPQQRLQAGLELPEKYLTSKKTSKQNPYTPDYRDPYDGKVDAVGDKLDPLPWRNGLGASVLGPWNPERSRQSPDLVRPPSTDHGNMANMRWSFADSHVRIEVRLLHLAHPNSMCHLCVCSPANIAYPCLLGRRMDPPDHRSRAAHLQRAGIRQHAPGRGCYPRAALA